MAYSMMGAVESPWKVVGGVVKPTNVDSLAAFKELQSQLSRLDSTIRADGDIGPATVRSYNKIAGGNVTAEQLAAGAITKIITFAIKLKADLAGLPAPKPMPPSRPVPKPDGTIQEMNPPEMSLMDTIRGYVTSPVGMAVGVGLIGLLIYSRSKGGKSSPAVITAPTVP